MHNPNPSHFSHTPTLLFIVVAARNRTDTDVQARYRVLFGIYLVPHVERDT